MAPEHEDHYGPHLKASNNIVIIFMAYCRCHDGHPIALGSGLATDPARVNLTLRLKAYRLPAMHASPGTGTTIGTEYAVQRTLYSGSVSGIAAISQPVL